MESDFSIVFLRTCEIDLMMGTVQISSPEDMVSSITELIHAFRELMIKYDLSLPGIITFSTIWEIDSENIKNFSIFLEDEM